MLGQRLQALMRQRSRDLAKTFTVLAAETGLAHALHGIARDGVQALRDTGQ